MSEISKQAKNAFINYGKTLVNAGALGEGEFKEAVRRLNNSPSQKADNIEKRLEKV